MAVKTKSVESDPVLDHLFRTSPAPPPARPRTTLKQDAAHATPGAAITLHSGTTEDKDSVLIPRDSIEANPDNPRKHFDPAALRELGESLKNDGQLQAILVRPHPRREGKYEIVVGERRWRAAGEKYGDIETLRCVVRAVSDAEARQLSLIENLKRNNLRPTETATALAALHEDVNARLQWADIAAAVGKTRQWVNDYVSLLEMAPFVQEAVDGERLTVYHARALRQLPHAQQVKIAQVAIREKLTSKEVEEGVREVLGKSKPPQVQPQQPQGQVLHFPTPRAALEGTGMVVPEDSAIERHAATVAQSTPITGQSQGTYVPRQPQIDPVDLMLKVCSGAQAVAAALPSLMNREHLYKSELRTLVAQTRAALDEIERVGQGQK